MINLEKATDQELLDEVNERELNDGADRKKLIRIWEEFRRRGDAPECLREYLYEMTGRAL